MWLCFGTTPWHSLDTNISCTRYDLPPCIILRKNKATFLLLRTFYWIKQGVQPIIYSCVFETFTVKSKNDKVLMCWSLYLLLSFFVPQGFPGSSEGKKSACNEGDQGLIPRLGSSPGEGNGLPTPVFSPGESHGQRSLADYNPWSLKEPDMTEWLTLSLFCSSNQQR